MLHKASQSDRNIGCLSFKNQMDSTIMLKLFAFFKISQALLDVYTIEREIGKLDGIKVGLVGDLANGRTVRSLAYLLAKYRDVKLYFVSPNVVKMKVIVSMQMLSYDIMNTIHDMLLSYGVFFYRMT